jgi:hypothetical protein
MNMGLMTKKKRTAYGTLKHDILGKKLIIYYIFFSWNDGTDHHYYGLMG